jgi:hypothetical protein
MVIEDGLQIPGTPSREVDSGGARWWRWKSPSVGRRQWQKHLSLHGKAHLGVVPGLALTENDATIRMEERRVNPPKRPGDLLPLLALSIHVQQDPLPARRVPSHHGEPLGTVDLRLRLGR